MLQAWLTSEAYIEFNVLEDFLGMKLKGLHF